MGLFDDLRPHRLDVWRETVPRNADGTRGTPAWARVSTALPCRFQVGESVKAPTGFVSGEQDNLFTLDLIHLNAGADVRVGDVLVQTTGPYPGEFWIAAGDAFRQDTLLPKTSVRASRAMDVDDTIREAYA